MNIEEVTRRVYGPGLCKCGCGAVCPIARTTDHRSGTVKGEPWNFLKGHSHRVSTLSDRERFEQHVYPDPNTGCRIFVGKSTGDKWGYGLFRIMGRLRLAHRVAWMFAHGELDDCLCVLHKCDTPCCVNPDHLFLGDRVANALDRGVKDRARRGQYPRGVTLRRKTGRFMANVYLPGGGSIYLGDFDDPEEAGRRVQERRAELWARSAALPER